MLPDLKKAYKENTILAIFAKATEEYELQNSERM